MALTQLMASGLPPCGPTMSLMRVVWVAACRCSHGVWEVAKHPYAQVVAQHDWAESMTLLNHVSNRDLVFDATMNQTMGSLDHQEHDGMS